MLDGIAFAELLGLLALVVLAARDAVRDPVGAVGTVPAVIAGAIAAYLTSELLKHLVAAERPCRVVAAVTCPPTGRWSFPSNHATVAAALATAALLLSPRHRWIVVPLALAAARLLTGVHAPHDIAGGLLLGVAVTVGAMLPHVPRRRPK